MPAESFETLAEGLSNFHETSHSTFLLEHRSSLPPPGRYPFPSLSILTIREENASLAGHTCTSEAGRSEPPPKIRRRDPPRIIFLSVFFGGRKRGKLVPRTRK